MSDTAIKENIDKYGWHYLYVFDQNAEKESFAYSIGFEQSFGHPEIMIFGLEREAMQSILAEIADEINRGNNFEPDTRTNDVLSGEYQVLFRQLKDTKLKEYAGAALGYYNKPIRVYIMFWPDKNNVLPTEQGCETRLQDEALEIV